MHIADAEARLSAVAVVLQVRSEPRVERAGVDAEYPRSCFAAEPRRCWSWAYGSQRGLRALLREVIDRQRRGRVRRRWRLG
jgi:hypothetical protein